MAFTKPCIWFFIDLFDGTLLVFLDGFFDVTGNLLGLANDLMLNMVKRPIAGISPSWTDNVLQGMAKAPLMPTG